MAQDELIATTKPIADGMEDGRLSTQVVAQAVASGGVRLEPIGPGHALDGFVGKSLQFASENWPWNDTFAALIIRIKGGTSISTSKHPQYQPRSEWWNFGWTVIDVECEAAVCFDPNIIILHREQATARSHMTIRSIYYAVLRDARAPHAILPCKPGPIVLARQPLEPPPATPPTDRAGPKNAWLRRNSFIARAPLQTVQEATSPATGAGTSINSGSGGGSGPEEDAEAVSGWDPPLGSGGEAGTLRDVDFMDPDA